MLMYAQLLKKTNKTEQRTKESSKNEDRIDQERKTFHFFFLPLLLTTNSRVSLYIIKYHNKVTSFVKVSLLFGLSSMFANKKMEKEEEQKDHKSNPLARC